MKAIAKHVRISPKKANLVAGLVRSKNAVEALDILKFTPKKAAKILYKVLHSAVANAENNFKQNKDALIVKEVVVTEGRTLKRSVPISRGRVHPILKRTSHITITVAMPEGGATKGSSLEGAKATEAKKEKEEKEVKKEIKSKKATKTTKSK
jgi:large subunit ribosomal protein L22